MPPLCQEVRSMYGHTNFLKCFREARDAASVTQRFFTRLARQRFLGFEVEPLGLTPFCGRSFGALSLLF